MHTVWALESLNDKISGVCLLATGNHGSFNGTDAHTARREGGVEEEALRR